ncbi:MAG: hypothetical protein IRZ15_09300 [Bryobacteraceae bacterium]|nr:hypothetical protein [Bryobacteraceae bacterium]
MTSKQQSARARLEQGFQILEAIRRRRLRKKSPELGASIERFIIQRELDELEADWKVHPPLSIGPDSE